MKIKDIVGEAGLYFRNYPCTKDCSGHRAGYEWALQHGITDPDDCPYDPMHNSFWEGCVSATEN